MSVNGSLSGITFGGLSSGLDTNGIIDKLVQLKKQPLTKLTQQQTDLQSKQQIYNTLGTGLTALANAANALNVANAFNPIAASSSDSSVATVTGSSTATAGSFSLIVSQLAQAEKIASSAQTDVTSALNLAGAFVVNGATVNVTATDSLTSIAQKINNLNVGVTASLINGGNGAAYLTIGSNSTGVSNDLQLSDTSGAVLNSLGLLSGAAGIRESITNGATSYGFNSSSQTVANLLGNSSFGASTVQINGVDVTINGSDSLQTIASNINSAGAGVTATVRTVTSGATTTYKLDIVGNSGTPTFSDSNNTLSSLGILQQPYGSELIKGQDAKYSLDGLNLTSASNTVTTAIPGATLTLLKGSAALPGTATISMVKDLNAIQSNVNAFVTAYNNVVDYIAQNSQLDTSTFNTGPLFGDSVADQVMSSLTSSLFSNVPGVTGQFSNLTGAGFTLDQSGHLVVDNSILSSALTSNPQGVQALFETVGNGSSSSISYVSDTTKTQASATAPYDVNITQVATKSSYTGEQAQTQASTVSEHLTFNGSLFSSSPYQLTLPSGSTAASTVAAINADSTLKNLVVASLDGGGNLFIQSNRYGSHGTFTVNSDLAAGPDNSGLGQNMVGATVVGVDVAGTINNEAATGSGQFLTGNSGNPTTDGLQIQYTGTATGAVGTISYSRGLAASIKNLLQTFTDPVNGLLTATNNSLQTQIDGLTTDMNNLAQQITDYQAQLQQQFSNMEAVIGQLQSQGSSLAAITNSTVTNTPPKATIPTTSG